MKLVTLVLYALMFALSAAVSIGAMRHAPRHRPARVESPAHVGCREIVVGEMWACPDGRVYTVDRGGWHDVGPITPAPVVPRG